LNSQGGTDRYKRSIEAAPKMVNRRGEIGGFGLEFWADWRVGCAFLAYDISRIFEEVRRDEGKEKP
jgi:hypothetical protein